MGAPIVPSRPIAVDPVRCTRTPSPLGTNPETVQVVQWQFDCLINQTQQAPFPTFVAMGYLLFNTLSAFILLFLPLLLVGGTSNYAVLLRKRLQVIQVGTKQSDGIL
jgi:hypothetical protein